MAKSSSALPILAGGAALLVATSGKKKRKKKKSGPRTRWGVRISKDCNTVEVVDPKLFNQFTYGAYDELISVDQSLSLIQVTDALFGEVAPDCSGFPEDPESAEIAELYAVLARFVGSFMVQDDRVKMNMGALIDEATQISFIDWYRSWRNYPSSDVSEPPANHVSFSSDLSSYQVGPNWVEETVRPFVQAAQEEGRLQSAYEDYVNNMGVVVGRFVMPISEIPPDTAAVKKFLAELEATIDSISSEAFTG